MKLIREFKINFMKKFNGLQENQERQLNELHIKLRNRMSFLPKQLKLKRNKQTKTNFGAEEVIE